MLADWREKETSVQEALMLEQEKQTCLKVLGQVTSPFASLWVKSINLDIRFLVFLSLGFEQEILG